MVGVCSRIENSTLAALGMQVVLEDLSSGFLSPPPSCPSTNVDLRFLSEEENGVQQLLSKPVLLDILNNRLQNTGWLRIHIFFTKVRLPLRSSSHKKNKEHYLKERMPLSTAKIRNRLFSFQSPSSSSGVPPLKSKPSTQHSFLFQAGVHVLYRKFISSPSLWK